MNNETKWDVIVVGGGPSGMMAAATAAEKGARVLLIEKNKTLGKKLLITGGGRCNVTNSEFDNRKLLEKFKDNAKFLFSTFSSWSVKETLDFFHKNGMPTKVENELRTFPVSNSAQSVWDVLVKELKRTNVDIVSNTAITSIIYENNIIKGVESNKKKYFAKSVIIATGGISRPETGSTGDGYKWLRNVGHSVREPAPSLVPISVSDLWAKKLAGVSLSDIKISVFQNEALQAKVSGKILFTHFGVSGPTILNLSRDIGELLKYGSVVITIDLLPKLNYGELNLRLQQLFKEKSNTNFKNALGNLVTGAIANAVVEISDIDPNVKCHSITRDERNSLVKLLKTLPLNVKGLLGMDKAVISSGGVALSEVDFKTMQSKIHPNLFLVGDILDIDRPSGGYSLQLCWTTGHVAGTNLAKFTL